MHFELNFPTTNSRITDEEFFELCRENRDLKFEKTSKGQVIFGMPTGGNTGNLNSKLIARLQLWSEADGKGVAFDSSTGFILPNGATRSPDAAWINYLRWKELNAQQRKKFPPLCPDFMVEIRSENDTSQEVTDKMKEYMENGCRLGWLIDPISQTITIFEGGKSQTSNLKGTITGGTVLPGFSMDLSIFTLQD